MNGIPGIWRTELWHPMVVHFPIVLLLGAAVLRLFSCFISGDNRSFLLKASRLSLWVGAVTAWLAVYTGSLADAIIVRDLCDPTVLEDHENAAYTIGVLFTAAAFIDLASLKLLREKVSLQKISEWIIIFLLLIGSGYVGYTAHLGASLVYQQAAAVYVPSAGCNEFE